MQNKINKSKDKQKKVAVIGAGFVGMAAAWDFVRKGADVTIFEASDRPGGLASGFRDENWDWSLEKHYHHIFKTDKDILGWMKEMGLSDLAYFSDTKSSLIYKDNRYQLDSPLSLLKFGPISFFSRIRSGIVLAFLKLFPKGQLLEKYTAKDFLIKTMGQQSWNVIWKPLFLGKFGDKVSKVNVAWFWARIHARSKQLGYFNGGFLNLAESVIDVLKSKKVKVKYNSPVKKLSDLTNKYDQVLVTTSADLFLSMANGLPKKYINQNSSLDSLGAMTLVLELSEEFFEDGTYWLNINEKDWPFLAVVEHTKFVDIKNYGGKTILYVGKYLKDSDEMFSLDKKDLLKKYKPFLEKLSPGFTKNINKTWLFREKFAQPVVGVDHSKNVPAIKTPLKNIYWASMQHVYPWDRGVNFAVEIGRRAAREMML